MASLYSKTNMVPNMGKINTSKITYYKEQFIPTIEKPVSVTNSSPDIQPIKRVSVRPKIKLCVLHPTPIKSK